MKKIIKKKFNITKIITRSYSLELVLLKIENTKSCNESHRRDKLFKTDSNLNASICYSYVDVLKF